MFATDRPVLTPEELAERYGRKTVTGMFEGKSLDWIEFNARMAGSYAQLAIAKREHVADVLAWYQR